MRSTLEARQRNEHDTLKDFQRRYKTFEMCNTRLLDLRKGVDKCITWWCPGSIDKDYRPLHGRKGYRCSICNKEIRPAKGCLFGHTYIDLETAFAITNELMWNRSGVPVIKIKERFGGAPDTIAKFMSAVRRQMGECLKDIKFDGDFVQIDEAGILSGRKGYPRDHKYKKSRGSERTSTVVAFAEKKGRARLFKVENCEANTLLPLIKEHVSPSTTIYTDLWASYKPLTDLGYKHHAVNHDVEYLDVDTGATTNACETIFSCFERTFKTYVSISDEHLHEYCNEIAFRQTFLKERDWGFETFLRSLSSLERKPGEQRLMEQRQAA